MADYGVGIGLVLLADDTSFAVELLVTASAAESATAGGPRSGSYARCSPAWPCELRAARGAGRYRPVRVGRRRRGRRRSRCGDGAGRRTGVPPLIAAHHHLPVDRDRTLRWFSASTTWRQWRFACAEKPAVASSAKPELHHGRRSALRCASPALGAKLSSKGGRYPECVCRPLKSSDARNETTIPGRVERCPVEVPLPIEAGRACTRS